MANEHAELIERGRNIAITLTVARQFDDGHDVDEMADALEAEIACNEALSARVAELENQLQSIADCKDMTLLGGQLDELVEAAPHREPTSELAHEIGAHKAFNQCAAIAEAALKDTTHD